jgi:hypothetical protein
MLSFRLLTVSPAGLPLLGVSISFRREVHPDPADRSSMYTPNKPPLRRIFKEKIEPAVKATLRAFM